jgi:HAD superfamily hydrolase (TIGR01509 family)
MTGTDARHGSRLLQAVLWDMDGTLVDTEPVWIAAEFELAARHGATWSREDALNLVGRDLLDSGRYIQQHMRLAMRPEQVVEALLDRVVEVVQQGVEWCPGARELLDQQQRAGVPAALVTMSYRRLADAIVSALPEGTFDVTVVGDEVGNGKPHPEPYLTAARALGVDPRRCIAIEDSTTGATSAQTAGCHVLAVPKHVAVPAAPDRTLATTLEGIDTDALEAMLAQARAGAR